MADYPGRAERDLESLHDLEERAIARLREAAQASPGDAHEGPAQTADRNGQPADRILRVPASQLRKLPPADRWFWRGLVPAEAATILSALPKAGKTTLLAHLLRAAGGGGAFVGAAVRPARVVYVTEESETLWADRRDRLGLRDHCEFVLRPFRIKPRVSEWRSFLRDLEASVRTFPAEVVILDTLAKLWPVVNENDASEVTDALMPLLELAYGLRVTLLLVHHLRKGDGLESTATRGSGGITAAVDSILELRRYRPADRKDRRRVLNCDARFDDRLDELVIRLAEDGRSYEAQGDREETGSADLAETLRMVLTAGPPGHTLAEVREAWPADEGRAPGPRALQAALERAAAQGWAGRDGEGRHGAPYRYYAAEEGAIRSQEEGP